MQRIKIPPVKEHDFVVGQTLSGTVKNRAEFGLFIDFKYDPPRWGLDGLLSFLRTPNLESARAYRVDDRIQVVVTKWDFNRERLDVALPANSAWLTPTVVALAEVIRAERSIELMPILGDALQEAGCSDELVLGHCRAVSSHEDNWLIPLILGAKLATPDAGSIARIACLWEANARKVGNVHRQRDFAELHYSDFVESAAAIAPVLSAASRQPVGRTILNAVVATRRVVSTNTNLGIILLLAPLAAVPKDEPLRSGLGRVLDGLDVEDSRLVYAAIRLAQPGGLGKTAQEDVRDEPTLPLRAVMALAAERDMIARQFSNGYQEVFDEAVPCLRRHLDLEKDLERAIVLTHLDILARHPDSLIARKKGLELAREVSRRAETIATMSEPARSGALAEFDNWLISDGLNPGTSADLIAACLFVALRAGIVKG